MTKANVIQLGLALFFVGVIGYVAFASFGLETSKAGIASEAVLISLVVAWVLSYFFRVVSGNMTFMEQRKRYIKKYQQITDNELKEKFDSMTNEEKLRLFEELDNENSNNK